MDEPVLSMEAVKAMCKEVPFNKTFRRIFLNSLVETRRMTNKIVPDWMIAGLNCTDGEEILPVCIHTFLMDWRPE